MAEFIRGTSSSLTPTQHSMEIFKNYLKQMSLKGLFGAKGSGKPIILDNKLKAQPGDTIRYHYIPQDETAGITGQNATILGNETSLDEYYFDLTVDQEAKAYRKKGKMTDQRIIWKFREETKLQLQNWWASRSEDMLIQALDGRMVGMTYTYAATTDLVTGTGRCIRASTGNGSAAVTAANSDDTALIAAMTVNDKMSCRLIEDAVIMARTAGTYKVRPVKVGPNDEEFFILLISLKAARDLRFSADWQNHAYSVIERGIGDDPIATGALGIWDNVIIRSSERILEIGTTGTQYARNLLLGADACVLGWVQTLDYTEELIDHKRILSMAADEIRGQTKVTYNSNDAGVVQVITASNA